MFLKVFEEWQPDPGARHRVRAGEVCLLCLYCSVPCMTSELMLSSGVGLKVDPVFVSIKDYMVSTAVSLSVDREESV
jgi:hypothetical protein